MRNTDRMSVRVRVSGLIGLAVLGIALVVVVWVGLRSRPQTGRSSAAPLVAARFSRPPRLALTVLTGGLIPPPLRSSWKLAASDNEVALRELRGHPLVVSFWASWCDPCRREAPLLQRVWRAQRGRVLFLGVNENDTGDAAKAFIRRFGVTYPAVREAGDATAVRWGVGGLPVTFFIADDGRVVAQSIGQLRPRQLRRGVDAARKGRL